MSIYHLQQVDFSHGSKYSEFTIQRHDFFYTNQPFIKTFSKYSFNVTHRRLHKTICFNCCSVNILTGQAIGSTRPIPPNRRTCLGCIWWKDMSNPKRLRLNIVLTEIYESLSAITNQSEHLDRRAIGTTRPIPPNRRSCKV